MTIDILKYKELPVSKIVIGHNVLLTSPLLEHYLKNMLQIYGQFSVVPVRVNEKGQYESISGGIIIKCLKDIGYKSAMCFDMGRLTLAEAKLASLEINLLCFDDDHIQISRLLNELVPAYPLETLYQKIPISQRKIDKLLELTTYDWETPTVEEKKRKELREAMKITKIKEYSKAAKPSADPYIETYKPITKDSFFYKF